MERQNLIYSLSAIFLSFNLCCSLSRMHYKHSMKKMGEKKWGDNLIDSLTFNNISVFQFSHECIIKTLGRNGRKEIQIHSPIQLAPLGCKLKPTVR